MLELRYYVTADGREVLTEWLSVLRDRKAVARMTARLGRLALGNLGDCEPVGAGVLELRIDWGPGYRVYFARLGQTVVLLLCGGDKKSQQRDIRDAKAYLEDYKARKKGSRSGKPSV